MTLEDLTNQPIMPSFNLTDFIYIYDTYEYILYLTIYHPLPICQHLQIA